MKTTAGMREAYRNLLAPGAHQGRPPAVQIIELLDDIDELLHANERLAPKAKAHDAAMAKLGKAITEMRRVIRCTPMLNADHFTSAVMSAKAEVCEVARQLVEETP